MNETADRPVEYMGHTWIRVLGGMYPSRFWDYRLLTDSELAELSERERVGYRRIVERDIPTLKKMVPENLQNKRRIDK